MQQALANQGPIALAIEVTDNFQSYSSGLFKDTTCHNTVDYLNHAVILVGYDTDLNGNQYYILRNQWGTSWVMNGYMQFARNNNNMCGIATDTIYPNLVVSKIYMSMIVLIRRRLWLCKVLELLPVLRRR